MNKKKILIVEDEYIISSDLQIRLEKLGFNVISIVTSGEEAVKIAPKVEPGANYWYLLECMEVSGVTEQYGPISLTIPFD